jgi:hypothetical protein
VLPLEGGRCLRRDPLATRIALRRGRLAALSSQGRAAANAPSVTARPTPDLTNSPARRPAATDDRPTQRGSLRAAPTRANMATPFVAGVFLRVREPPRDPGVII